MTAQDSATPPPRDNTEEGKETEGRNTFFGKAESLYIFP
jgi:hypothetical protein